MRTKTFVEEDMTLVFIETKDCVVCEKYIYNVEDNFSIGFYFF